MPIYKLEEARLIQQRGATSAANALNLSVGGPGVPQGKLWIVTAFGYMPSVAETQVVSVEKYTAGNYFFGLINPASLNLNPAQATFIEQGMEYLLFPGEYLIVRRVAATAASTMTANMQFVEIDLPLYTYDEPQVVKRQQRAISSVRSMLGGGSGGGGGVAGGRGSGGRSGGGPLPV